jgi:hypothetical protein
VARGTGAAQTAKAPPSSARDPRLRAPTSSPGATTRSGTGSRPTNASPITTRTNPAMSACAFGVTTFEIAAAPAPTATKTSVKPRMNGTLAIAMRRADPARPSSSGSTPDTAER